MIDERETFLVKPSLPEVAFGLKRIGQITFSLRDTVNRAADFIHSRVLRIDPQKRVVEVEGAQIPYDVLVVALGATKEWDKVPGFIEDGSSVCTEVLAPRLYQRIAAFNGGTIMVGSAPTPTGSRLPDVPVINAACEGPVGEVAFLADHWLRQHGKRDDAKIVCYTPGPVFFDDVGDKVHQAFGSIAKEHQIDVITNKVIRRIESGRVFFEDGSEYEAALTVMVPTYSGPSVVKDAGLTDEAGFIPTDGDFRHLDYDNIFAVGDIATRAVPKLGHLAVLQATRVASVLRHDITHQGEVPSYDPEVFCIMNMGSKALLIRSNVLYGGDMDIAYYGGLSHTLKTLFDEYTVRFHGKMPPDLTQRLLNAYLDKVAK
ncbi:sulfide-quinone oxidoreductase [Sulfobacillus acidophilus TPY]|nr:sulfide-quinone oxidoreductase [Sulfobacillus acidophilus TPY]